MAKEATNLKEAIDYYSKANDEWQEARILFFEKIALYSGAIISLSITFLGYLISQDASVFLYNFLWMPLYSIIFTAWFFLTLSLLLGVYVRLLTAEQISRMMHVQWVQHYAKSREDMINEVENGMAQWNGNKNSFEAAKKTVIEYEKVQKEASSNLKRFNFMTTHIYKITTVLFMLGCLLTLCFVASAMLVIANTPVENEQYDLTSFCGKQ